MPHEVLRIVSAEGLVVRVKEGEVSVREEARDSRLTAGRQLRISCGALALRETRSVAKVSFSLNDPRYGLAARLFHNIRRAFAALETARRRRATRALLAQLDRRTLRDIGLDAWRATDEDPLAGLHRNPWL